MLYCISDEKTKKYQRCGPPPKSNKLAIIALFRAGVSGQPKIYLSFNYKASDWGFWGVGKLISGHRFGQRVVNYIVLSIAADFGGLELQRS
jgi:hypothetical protein